MPKQDGQGPVWGGGTGAGWGYGPCGAGRGWGRGRGMGWENGFGFRNRMRLTKAEEIEMLDKEEQALKEELADLQAAKEQLKNEEK
jgi:hypothetical protein